MAKLSTHWLAHRHGRMLIREWAAQGHAKGVVHVVHDQGMHSGAYQDVACEWCQRGWHVVAYDQPGSGLTVQHDCDRGHVPHASTLLDGLQQVSDWVQLQHPCLPVIRYGHGMGVALVLHAYSHGLTCHAHAFNGGWLHWPWLKQWGATMGACVFGEKNPVWWRPHSDMNDPWARVSPTWAYYRTMYQLMASFPTSVVWPTTMVVAGAGSSWVQSYGLHMTITWVDNAVTILDALP